MKPDKYFGKIKKLIFIGILILSGYCAFSSNLKNDSSGVIDTNYRVHNEPYFYHGYNYGSEGKFNPLTVILNRGFEMFRITSGQLYYNPAIAGYKFTNVVENLSHPVKYIKIYGTANFFKEQVIPFGNVSKPYWYPNYTLHLLAGGITYTGLKEWFEFNQIPFPKLLSAVTLLGSALINESVEEKLANPGFRLNVDAVADVLIFDIGGILLFQSKKVNKFFSKTLNMRDWSKQPMIVFPGTNLANCGQFISLKWKLPFVQNWYFFSMVGLGGMGGLSYKFSDHTGLSIGFGQGPKRKDNELFGLPIDVSLVPMGGIYYDKNNSLLASLEFSNSKNDVYHNYFSELNIYPGLIPIKKIDPSLWLAIARDGNVLFGISTKYMLGMGVGLR